jgi:hypothetical protein
MNFRLIFFLFIAAGPLALAKEHLTKDEEPFFVVCYSYCPKLSYINYLTCTLMTNSCKLAGILR